MDEIEAIYERVKDRISLEEFLVKVDETERFMGGLADKITAARLVVHNMGGNESPITIEHVTPDMQKAIVVGKVVACSDVRNFNREDGSMGSVANLTVADETGSIRVVLWDQAADLVKVGDIVFGDAVKVSGFVKEGRIGLEISVGRGGSVEKLALDQEIQVRKEPYSVEKIKPGMSDVHLVGKILDISGTRTFQRKDGSNGKVRNVTLGDPTGKICLTLWGDLAENMEQFKPGDSIEIMGGYARENSYTNQVEVNLGNHSSMRLSSKNIEFREVITPISDIEINRVFNIMGYITGLDELREFQRKDGSTGRVVNIHISDDTGRIRASLWGKHVELIHEIDIGTKLQITDCYAKAGWNDEVELSVGERGSITILED